MGSRDGEGTYKEEGDYGGWTHTQPDHQIIANTHGWGAWTYWKTCPENFYMCGFSVRIDHGEIRRCGGDCADDTGMNGIRMTCCRMPWDVDQTNAFTDLSSTKPSIDTQCGSDSTGMRSVNGGNVCSFNMNGETWHEAVSFCSNKGLKLASAADIKAFRSGPGTGDVWTPISDITNDWMQIGEKTNYPYFYGKRTSTETEWNNPWWGLHHEPIYYKKYMYCKTK